MTIRTDTDRMQTLRRNIIRLMIAEHPESCVVCNKGNRCELRRLAAQLGIGETGLRPMPNAKSLEQANPFIVRDLSKCILCGKCIRADHPSGIFRTTRIVVTSQRRSFSSATVISPVTIGRS